jgi:hypothetical protein
MRNSARARALRRQRVITRIAFVSSASVPENGARAARESRSDCEGEASSGELVNMETACRKNRSPMEFGKRRPRFGIRKPAFRGGEIRVSLGLAQTNFSFGKH